MFNGRRNIARAIVPIDHRLDAINFLTEGHEPIGKFEAGARRFSRDLIDFMLEQREDIIRLALP